MEEQDVGVSGRLNRFLDYFIPENVSATRDGEQRARMFLLSHFFGPILGNVLPLFMWLSGFPLDYRLIVFAGSITMFWAFPFMLRWTGRYVPLAILSIQNLIFTILWACYAYGGTSSPFVPWLVTIPLLAFFYLNPAGRVKFGILALLTANIAALYILTAMGLAFPEVDMKELEGPGMLSMVSAAAYVAMMAIYYANILASQVDLESELRDHKTTANELRHTTEASHKASAAKSDFIANMSHELRTPLNAVIGYSQMLMDDALIEGDQETADDLEKIQSAGQHLLRLVNDVLDFSKIEAGKMEVTPDNIDFNTALENIAEDKRAAVEAQRNRLDLDLAPGLGEGHVDWSLTSKIISHLLENAAQFTEGGVVTLAARRLGPNLRIEVSDTGAGIAADAVPRLFNAFSVAAEETSSKYGGAGIGLALSGRICKILGGTINVQSVEGHGSTFALSLPVMKIETPTQQTNVEAA